MQQQLPPRCSGFGDVNRRKLWHDEKGFRFWRQIIDSKAVDLLGFERRTGKSLLPTMEKEKEKETRMTSRKCQFWLPRKKRFCAVTPIHNSAFCGNHSTRADGRWVPCPIDPSHSVLEENLNGHLQLCPLLKHTQSLSLLPFYQKGINAGNDESDTNSRLLLSAPHDFDTISTDITSEMKRRAVHALSTPELHQLISKIKSVHTSICNAIPLSYKNPEACSIWINGQVDRKLPFQEKHVRQQVSILGNLEELGVLKSCNVNVKEEQPKCESSSTKFDDAPAVVEFGAGRGYLTQMLADCYHISKIFLVERKSYKLKADRSLRQKENVVLERLRIDIEDLNLSAIEPLRGLPYLAIGKHLCGPATDMTLRCCIGEQSRKKCTTAACYLRGLAIATCCHHLCQWKHYINKSYISNLGVSKDDFHAITWFTSWAVDADHGSDDCREGKESSNNSDELCNSSYDDDDILMNMNGSERAALGFMCKDIIDAGRWMWIKEQGLESRLVKYVPSTVSPENRLLIAVGDK